MTKNRLMSVMEALLLPALIAGIWYVYSNYLLFQNPDGSYSYVVSSPIMATVTIVTVIALLMISVLVLSHFNCSYHNRVSAKTTSQLTHDLSRLALDADFENHFRRLGVDLGFTSIRISPEILVGCSLEDLAGLIVAILQRNHFLNLGIDKIIESLAEIILRSWSKDEVSDFVDLVYDRDIIIGEQLKYAVDYQEISREVDEFQKGIEDRLVAIEKRRTDNSTKIISKLDQQFERFDYLAIGGSTFKRWLRSCLTNHIWRKPATIK